MRVAVSLTVILLGALLSLWPHSGRTHSDREFVFTDEDGHLLVRFPGVGPAGLDWSQAEEISSAEFSSMVHDRLRADLRFEAERPDDDWAAWMEPRIKTHVERVDGDFSSIFIQCRALSCRIVMEQPAHSSVPQHRAVLETVQESLQAFIVREQEHFEPAFMITAYDQETQTPHIKAFLRRTGYARLTAGPE